MKVFAAALLCVAASLAAAQPASAPAAPPAAPATALLLFAVEIKTGSAWDSSKAAQDQPHFREHSANLRKLREQGLLLLGARYSDKGLIVLEAASADEAHALMRQDALIQARVFGYELHSMNVFYGGAVEPPPRPPRPAVPAQPAVPQ